MEVPSSYFPIQFDPIVYNRWKKRLTGLLNLTRIETRGLNRIPREKAVILAPNHLGWKDILLVGCHVRRSVSFVATSRLFDRRHCENMLKELWISKPILRLLYYPLIPLVSCFLVSRVKVMGAIPAKLMKKEFSLFNVLKSGLREGRVVCIFPEGRPGKPGRLRRFKWGLSRLLYDYYEETNQKVPVYPIGISGTERFFFPGIEMKLHVGNPIYMDQFFHLPRVDAMKQFNQNLKEEIIELISM